MRNLVYNKLNSIGIADSFSKVALLIEMYGINYNYLNVMTLETRLSYLKKQLKPKEFITVNKTIIRVR